MQNQRTEGRFKRLTSNWRGRRARRPNTATTPPQDHRSQTQVANTDYNDRHLVQIRYEEAANSLKEAIKIRKGSWGPFDFEELSGEPEGFDDSQFKNKINAVFLSREASIKDRKGWSKFTHAVECIFTAFSPFAKNFLVIAQTAQSVISPEPCLIYSYSNRHIDTCSESIRLNLRWSLSVNNGCAILIVSRF